MSSSLATATGITDDVRVATIRSVRPFARLEFANFQGQYSLFLFCRQWIARKENPACAGLLRSVFFAVATLGINRE